MKKRTKGREKKVSRSPGKVNFDRHLRNGTVNSIKQFFPPIRLATGLEVKQRVCSTRKITIIEGKGEGRKRRGEWLK